MPEKQVKNYRIAIQSICDVLGTLDQELSGDLSLNQIRVLTQVMKAEAANENIEMRDLCVSLKLSRGAVSRYVATLTTKGCAGRPGLGLLVQNEDASDRRVRRVSLTKRGHEVTVYLGECMRRMVLDYKERVIELILDKSNSISVLAGVDPESKTSVYRVVGTYGSSTYRQIFMKMMHWADHQIYHDEIIDLTAVGDFDMDKAKLPAAIQLTKQMENSLTRRMCYLTDDPAIFKRLKQIEAAYIDAGVSSLSVHDNLSDIRTLLGLPNEWEYPDLIPLIT